MRDSVRVLPDDDFNRTLVRNVHPPDWVNPEPAARYNLVGGGVGLATIARTIHVRQETFQALAGVDALIVDQVQDGRSQSLPLPPSGQYAAAIGRPATGTASGADREDP